MAKDIIYFAISMLEIDLEYDVCCKHVEFHTINGDESAWEQAIKHIGTTLNDVKIGQFAETSTRRPKLPDNWGDLQDHNSLPVVVWIKKLTRKDLEKNKNNKPKKQTWSHTQTTRSNCSNSTGVDPPRARHPTPPPPPSRTDSKKPRIWP